MLQYIYQPEDIGLSSWPSGELRLNFERTMNPSEADIFTVPGALHMFKEPASLDQFPYMKGNESRHVFFHCSDDEVRYGKPCLFIRCNTRPWNFKADPNTIPWSWPVENFAECINLPEGGFKYDVSFQGMMSSNSRRYSIESCEASRLKSDIKAYPDFFGYIQKTEEGQRRRAEFIRSMRESRLALCGESIPGVFPYRFWEAMSAARIPVLIGSDQVFPWLEEIHYENFMIHIPRAEANHTGEILSGWLADYSDEVVERGRMGRQMWERYIDSTKWVDLMTEAVEKAVRAMVFTA